MQIIVRYQFFNKKRYIEEVRKKELQNYFGELQSLIDIEVNKVWETGVIFEMQQLNTALVHLRTNQKIGNDIFAQFIIGLATSLVSFKASDELLDALKEAAKLLFIKFLDEPILNPIEIYKVYYFFKEFKWKILFSLGSDLQVYQIIEQLKHNYNAQINGKKNWIIHYCWIEFISDLLVYRPIVHYQNMPKELWNKLQQQQQLIILPYNKNEAAIDLPINKQSIISNNSVIIDNIDYIQFSQLKATFMNKSLIEDQSFKLWNQYLKFDFNQGGRRAQNKQDEQLISQLTNLVHPDLQLIKILIQECQVTKTNYINACEQKLKLLGLLNQYSQFQSEARLQIIQDIHQIYDLQNQCLLKILFSLNEFAHYLLYFVEKLKIFSSFAIQNFKDYSTSTIDNFIKTNDLFQVEQLKNLVKSWKQILQQIAYEQVNLNSQSKLQLNQQKQKQSASEKHKEAISFFDLPLALMKTINTQMETIEQQINNSIKNYKGQCQNLQLIDIKEIVLSFQKIQIVQMIPNIIEVMGQQSKDENTPVSLKWKFSNQIELEYSLVECLCLIQQLKILKSFLQVQTVKQQQLILYFEKLQEEQENKELGDCNFKQQFVQIKALLAKHNSYFQSIKIDKSIETQKQLQKQIKLFEQELNLIKNTLFSLNVSQKMQITIKSLNLQILCNINLLALLNEDCREKIICLLKLYDTYQKQIDEEMEQLQIVQKQPNIQNEIKSVLENLKCLNISKEIQQLSQQLDKWASFSLVLQNMIDIQQINQQELKNFSLNLEIVSLAQQTYVQLDSTIKSVVRTHSQFQNVYLNEQKCVQLEINFFLEFYPTVNRYRYAKEDLTKNLNSQDEYVQYLKDLMNHHINESITKSNKFIQYFENKSYKVRECLLFNLIKMQVENQDSTLFKFTQELIKQFWLSEKDQKVRELLRNNEMIEMQRKIFNYDQQTFSDQLQNEIKMKMEEIEKLELYARLEGQGQKGQELETSLREKYEEFEQIFANINEMQDQLGLNLFFLKELSKELKLIKNKIDKLQDSIDILANDVRRLRGKPYFELLKLREEKVLYNMNLRELDSVYIELKTQEINPETRQNILTENGQLTSSLFKHNYNDFEGEINEFLWSPKETNKDVLLLKGQAGSGKSRAAKMIEEFIWQHWEIIQQDKARWVPIFVSLPQLKDPKFNLLNEALQLDNYQFDQFQTKELLESIQKDQLKVVLIFDSFDEMSSANIDINLYLTNRFHQEFSLEIPGSKLKIIITVRTEILKQYNYQNLFVGNSIKNLKEIELLPFTKEQASDYLSYYCKLNVRKQIKSLYDFIRQAKGYRFDLKQFITIIKPIDLILQTKHSDDPKNLTLKAINHSKKNEMEKFIDKDSLEDFFSIIFGKSTNLKSSTLNHYFNYSNQTNAEKSQNIQQSTSFILNQNEIETILKDLKKCSFFDKIDDQMFLALQKDLASIWSKDKFEYTIKNINVEHLLQTPFMMEMVIQVLPQIINIYSDRQIVFMSFQENFLKLTKKLQFNQILSESYQNGKQSQTVQLELKKIKQNINQRLSEISRFLEEEKFFKYYSISDEIIQENKILIINNLKIQFDEEENAEIVVKSLKKQNITMFDFYQNFVQFYSEMQLEKWKILGEIINSESLLIDFQEYQESLALDMTIRELTQVIYRQKGRLKFKKVQYVKIEQDSWQDQYFNNYVDHKYQKILRSCVLLTGNGSTYSFNHKSIQEFFVGKFILGLFNQMCNQDNSRDNMLEIQELFTKSIFNENEFNISKVEYSGILQIIKEKILLIKKLKKKLISIINFSKLQNLRRTSSNCLYILKLYNIYLIEEKLNDISISDISIEGLQMHNCDLSGSQFNNVLIDSCNFNLCNLQNVNWTNIIYKQPKKFKTSFSSVLLAAYFQNRFLATIGMKNIVQIYDMKDAKLVRAFKCLEEQVDQMVFSNNGKLLALSNQINIVIWNVEFVTESEPCQVAKLFHQSSQLNFSFNDVFLIAMPLDIGPVTSWNVEELIQNYIPDEIVMNYVKEISASSFFFYGDYLILGFQDGRVCVYIINENFQLKCRLTNHSNKILLISIADEIKQFATGSWDKIINVWILAASNEIQNLYTISSHFRIKKLSFVYNEKLLYALEGDKFIYKLNPNKDKKQSQQVGQFSIDEKFQMFCFNHIGNVFIAINQEKILIFQFSENGKEISEQGQIIIQEKGKDFENYAFSNSKYLALNFMKSIEIWDYYLIKLIHKIETTPPNHSFFYFKFSSDDKQFFIAQNFGFIQIWNTYPNFVLQHEIRAENIIAGQYFQLFFSPSNQFYFIMQSQSVQIFDSITFSQIKIICPAEQKLQEGQAKHRYHFIQLLFSPSNKFMLLNSKTSLHFFDATTFDQINIITPNYLIYKISFWENDQILFVCSQQAIYIYIFQDGTTHKFKELLLYAQLCNFEGLVTIPQYNKLITVFYQVVIVWDKLQNDESGKLFKQCCVQKIQGSLVGELVFSHLYQIYIDYKVRMSDTQVLLVPIENKSNDFELIEGHQNIIRDMSFSPKNEYFISISENECIIWQSSLRNILKIFPFGGYSVQFIDEARLVFHNLDLGLSIVNWQTYQNDFYVVDQLEFLQDLDFTDEDKIYEISEISCKLRFEEMQICYSFHYDGITFCFVWQMTDFYKFHQIAFFYDNHLHTLSDLKNKKILYYNSDNGFIIQNPYINGIFNKRSLKKRLRDHQKPKFTITNKNQIFIAFDQSIQFYYDQEKLIHSYKIEKTPKKIHYVEKTSQLLVLSENQILILNYNNYVLDKNKKFLIDPILFHIFETQNKLSLSDIQVSEQLSLLITFSGSYIYILDIKTKQTFLPIQTDNQEIIQSIAISNDGTILVSISQCFKIWNLTSQLQISAAEVHSNYINQLVFSFATLYLLSHSQLDSIARIWDIKKKKISKVINNLINIKMNSFQALTAQFKIFESNNDFKFQYLDLFEQIQLKLKNSQCCYFLLSENGKNLSIFSDNEMKLYKDFNFLSSEPFVKFDFKKPVVFLNPKKNRKNTVHDFDQNQIFLYLSQTSQTQAVIYDPNKKKVVVQTNVKSYKYEITFEMQSFIFQNPYLIIQEKNSQQLVVYKIESKYFNENKKIQLIGHSFEINFMLSYSTFLISMDESGTIVFWDLEAGSAISSFELREYSAGFQFCSFLEISNDHTMLAIGYENGKLLVLNIEDKKNITEKYNYLIPDNQQIELIVFHPNDNIVACLSNEFIWYFNLNNQFQKKVLRSTFKCSSQFAFDSKNPYILCIQKTILRAYYLYDCFDYQELQIKEEIGARKFFQDVNFFVYSNQDNFLKIFDIQNQKIIGQIEYIQEPKKIIISQSYKIIITLNIEDQLECFMLPTFLNISQHIVKSEFNKNVTCMEITYDDQVLAFGNEFYNLILMKLNTCQILFQIDNFTSIITSIAFSFNQQIFALGCKNGTILLYSYNYKNLDSISQLKDDNFQLDFSKKPLCIKIFGRNPIFMAEGCKINENSKILTPENEQLKYIFLQNGAIETNN